MDRDIPLVVAGVVNEDVLLKSFFLVLIVASRGLKIKRDAAVVPRPQFDGRALVAAAPFVVTAWGVRGYTKGNQGVLPGGVLVRYR